MILAAYPEVRQRRIIFVQTACFPAFLTHFYDWPNRCISLFEEQEAMTTRGSPFNLQLPESIGRQ
jgi:hypothetical protein